MLFVQIKSYPNCFFLVIKSDKGKKLTYNSADGGNIQDICNLLMHEEFCGFGLQNVGTILLGMFYRTKSAKATYSLAQKLQRGKITPWDGIKIANAGIFLENAIDLKEVSAGVNISLSVFGARIGSKDIYNDYPPNNTKICSKDIKRVIKCMLVDVDIIQDLYNKIKDRIDLRRTLSKQHKANLLSKSDPAIAELVMRNITGIAKAPSKKYSEITYQPPTYITFKTESLNNMLDTVSNTNFKIGQEGYAKVPDSLKNINVGGVKFKIGLGGLHSQERNRVVNKGRYEKIIDCDVTAYYPSIILNNNATPKHLTALEKESFLEGYRGIVEDRIEAKKNSQKQMNDILKIVINGLFGKFGNKYSAFYSPELLLFITITGQLSLLMLIEKYQEASIDVLSANTDGIICGIPKGTYDTYKNISQEWEATTGFQLEYSEYNMIASQSVNHYFAEKPDGTIKAKGCFCGGGLSITPSGHIVNYAVMQKLLHNTAVEATITSEQPLWLYIYARTSSGGCLWKGASYGKVVRWVKVKEGGDVIRDALSGRKVAKSDGAKVVERLDEIDPNGLDLEAYINDANKILKTMGCDSSESWF